jgi:hypothetical protein
MQCAEERISVGKILHRGIALVYRARYAMRVYLAPDSFYKSLAHLH